MSTGSPQPSTTPEAPQPPQYPPYPPGPFPPQMFYQPPPPQDGSEPPPAQYMVYPPMYAYPVGLPPQPLYPPNPNPSVHNESRQKRKQVKTACTNCATACKRCDESRPCERCEKYGIADSCVDGQRKERKKGVKRGPYKRKNKNNAYVPQTAEWHPDLANAAQAGLPTIPFQAPDGTIQYYPFLALPMPESAAGGPTSSGSSDQPPQQHPMMSFMFPHGAFVPPPHPYAAGYAALPGLQPPPPQPSTTPPEPATGPSTPVPSEEQPKAPTPESPSKADFALSARNSPDPIAAEDHPEARDIVEEEEDEEDMEPVIVSSSKS